jgi:2-polyprenyl-3-methyl-5-hydroxy-6-metoxy-1,4-benzoquinol methylase
MNTIGLAGHACRICGAAALREFERFRGLARVTSDSRTWKAGGRLAACFECGGVQKLVEPHWLDEIRRIYQSYAIYHQAGGNEQPIFAVNGARPRPRSAPLLEFLEEKLQLPTQANILDFGCGTGAALKTFSARHPAWRLYGAELSAQNTAILQKIPNFSGLFTCPPADIPLRFELITLVHALEHVLDPIATLKDLSSRLDGALFVQVPDAAKTAYDLIIADHLSHFTLDTLCSASQCAGLEIIILADDVLPKELSLIARRGKPPDALSRPPDPYLAVERVHAQIDWLYAQTVSARAIAAASSRFGLFGTSISATWLAGLLGDRVAFFVDEDDGRIGGKHIGQPILSPDEIPSGADVFVPLIPEIAASVAQRLVRPGVTYHAPAKIGASSSEYEVTGPC